MKLHLPLSLRSALLAACAIAGLSNQASAAVSSYEDWGGGSDRLLMESDFIIKGNEEHRTAVHQIHDSSDSTEFKLDGNKRQYSYLLEDIQCSWLDSAKDERIGTIDMINMDQIAISGILASKYNIFNVNIEKSNSFTFSHGGNNVSTAILTKDAAFRLSLVDNVKFDHNIGNIFHEASSITFDNITKFVYENNEGTLALYKTLGKGTDHPLRGPSFTNCEEILIANNKTARGLITNHTNPIAGNATGWSIFENCGTITFKENIINERDIFSVIEPMFVNCEVVEFNNNTANQSSLIGRELVANNVTTLRINDNKIYHPDTSLAAYGMLLGASNAIYNDHLEASGDQTKSVLEIKNNIGEGRFLHIVSKEITISNYKKVDISGNSLDFITNVAISDVIGSANMSHVDEILISKNRVSGGNTIKGIIGFEKIEDIGTLELSGNIIGLDKDGNIITQGTANAETTLLAGTTLTGRNDGVLSSIVRIDGNKISTATYGKNASLVISGLKNTFNDLQAIEVTNNTIKNAYRWLGTNITLNNISNVDISDNTMTVDGTIPTATVTLDRYTLENTESFKVENNTTIGTATVGGALGLRLNSTDTTNVLTAKKVDIKGNKAIGKAAYGGAIRVASLDKNYVMYFANCGEINIIDNGAQASSLEEAVGGAIAYTATDTSRTLEFAGNDKVVIRGNYITDGSTTQLNAIDINKANLTFKTRAGQTVEGYDSIMTTGNLNINGDSKDIDENYVGTITFSGKYTVKDLENLGAKPTEADLQASRTIQGGQIHIYNGTLNLEDGIRLVATKAGGFTSDSAATVQMKNATLHLNSTDATASLPTAVFEGHNVIEANSVTASNGTWTFKVESMNRNESILDVAFTGTKGKITMDGQTFQIDRGSDLENGQYMLMEFDQSNGSWIGSDKITFVGTETSALGSEGEDDIYYTVNDGTYTLWYEYTKEEEQEPTLPDTPTQPDDPTLPDTPTQPDDPTLPDTPTQPEKPAQRGAATLTWIASTGTWSNSAGASAGTWYNKDVEDLNFYNGDSVVFNQDAEVTVKDKVRPADVKVTNKEGQVILTSEDGGQITGKTSITKTGAGELVLDLDNAYEGGTTIEDGKLTVKKRNALGLGSVQLKGGELNLSGLAVPNDVIATGEAVFNGGSAYEGTLTLEGGKLTGDVINVAEIADLREGSIANGLTGAGKVEKNGKGTVTLSGVIKPEGGTEVNEGTLILNGATYSGNLTVNEGGKLSVSNSSFAAYISMHAGSAIEATGSGLSLAKGTTLVSDGASFEGNLIMTGGTLKLSAPQDIQGDVTLSGGIVELSDTLTVSGNLSATEVTQVRVDVQKLLEKKKLTLFTAADASSVESSLIYLTDLQDARINTGVEDNMKDFVLELDNAVLVWQPGTTGNWGVKDAGEWSTDKVDHRFYNLDEVVFDSAGEVNVVGEVNPSKITVKGDKDTSFVGEGSLIGAAALTKSGKGSLTMGTDNSSYKGDISVTDGALNVNNEHALGSGNVFINSAKFNGGYYSIHNLVTFSGNSAMEHADGLTTVVFADDAQVSGNYTLATGNKLTIGSKGAAFTGDFTFAGGTLKLSGMNGVFNLSEGHTDFGASGLLKDASAGLTTIDITDWTDITYGKAYALISMITDEKAVDQFTIIGANRYKLSYEDDTLWITIQRPELNKKIADQLNSNQRAAYEALDAILKAADEGQPNDDDVLRKLADETLGTDDAATAAALLNRLNGAELATTMTSQMEGNMAHLRRLRANMGSGQIITKDGRGSAYVIGYDDLQRIDDNAKGQGIRRTEWGGTLGFEHVVRNQSLVGIALSNGRATVEPTDGNRYHEDTARIDFYAVADLGRGWQSVTSVGIGAHSFDLTRNLPGGYHTLASMDGISLNVLEEISYTIRVNEANRVQPFIAVESSINSIDSFTEQGAGTASLAGGSQNAWAMDVTVGARFIHTFTTYSGLTGSVNLQAGFIASLGDTSSELNLHFVGAPKTSFSVSTADHNHLGYNLSAGVLVPVTKQTSISISAGAIMRGDSEEASASVGVRVKF